MRSELEKLKYIEDYLTGNLPADEVKNFAEEIANNPELAKEVEFQKQIIKRSERMAFKEQLNALHQANFPTTSKKWWQQNIYLNSIIGGVVIAGAITSFMLMDSDQEEDLTRAFDQPKKEIKVETKAEVPDKKESEFNFNCDTNSTPTSNQVVIPDNLAKAHGAPIGLAPNAAADLMYEEFEDGTKVLVNETEEEEEEEEKLTLEDFVPQYDTIMYSSIHTKSYVYDRSGTVIHLPKNLIKGKENTNEFIPLLYREFRNQAEIAFSGIPMIFKEKGKTYEFESGGMFEFIPLDSTLEMNEKAKKDLTINFALTTDTLDLDFYELEDNVWVKQGEMFNSDTIPEWWPPCDTGKVCDFTVSVYAPSWDTTHVIEERLSGWRGLFGGRRFRKEKISFEKESAKWHINGIPYNEDEFVTIDFEIKIPARAANLKFINSVHPAEAMIYLKDPMKSIEVRKALYGNLMLTCKKCANKDKWASPEKLASLYSPTYNRDSLYKEVEKRRAVNADENVSIIEAQNILSDKTAKTNYKRYKYKKKQGSRVVFVALKLTSFGVANCDMVRPIKNYNKPTIIKAKFLTESGEKIKVDRVSRIYLDRNSAFSYPNRKIEMWEPINQVFIIFTKNGVYYVNTIAVDELYSSNPNTCVANKLDDSVRTAEGLMKFLNSEKAKTVMYR